MEVMDPSVWRNSLPHFGVSLRCDDDFTNVFLNLFLLLLLLGDKYINGEIIPCKYPTYQPKRSGSKYESRRYERRRDGPPPDKRRPRQEATTSDSASG